MKLKQHFWVGWAIAAIVLSSCWDQTTLQRQQSEIFYPTPTLPLARGGSKKFINDLGLL